MSEGTIEAELRASRPAGTDIAAARQALAGRAEQEGLLDVALGHVDTPIGRLLVAATAEGVVRVAFASEGEGGVLEELTDRISPRMLRAPKRVDPARRELEEYFEGERRRFSVPVDLRLTRGFRREVLEELRSVPFGATTTYAALAADAGRPRAVRAAGTAMATNPIPVIVPCHRVVRSDGSLGGYGGGLEAKEALLRLEGSVL